MQGDEAQQDVAGRQRADRDLAARAVGDGPTQGRPVRAGASGMPAPNAMRPAPKARARTSLVHELADQRALARGGRRGRERRSAAGSRIDTTRPRGRSELHRARGARVDRVVLADPRRRDPA